MELGYLDIIEYEKAYAGERTTDGDRGERLRNPLHPRIDRAVRKRRRRKQGMLGTRVPLRQTRRIADPQSRCPIDEVQLQ